MLNTAKRLTGVILVSLIYVMSCSSHKTINVDETYSRLKPAAPLPESLVQKQPANLIIDIANVADMSNSYKNRLTVYVNDCVIRPDEESNIKSRYYFALSLQPGFYDVKAVYYASTGWMEKKFDIVPKDRVMVFADKQTVLKVNLRKDSWGAPVDKVTHFDMSFNPIQSASK